MIPLVCGLLPSMGHSQYHWIDSVRKVASIQKEDTNKVWTLRNMGDYYEFNDPDSGIYYAKRALSLAQKLNYDRGIFWSIVSLDHSLFITGNYALELDYALSAKTLAAKLNDRYAFGWSNGLLADSYFNLGDCVTAMQYVRVVLATMAEDFPTELFSGYAVTVPLYVGLHYYDSALIYGKKSLELLRMQPALYYGDGDDSKYARNQVYLSLGDAFQANQLYDSALYYYRKSLPYAKELNLKTNIIRVHNGMAKIFSARHEPKTAIAHAKIVLGDRVTNAYPSEKILAAILLADVYEGEKRMDSSLKYLRISVNLKDSIYNREKTTAFQNLLLKDLNRKKEILTATAELRHQYIVYLLVGLFIVLIVITSIVVRNRRVKQLQKIRNSIADDLHDDIGSTLSSISIMNELAKAKSPEAIPLLTSIGEYTAAMQENMSDIVWTVNPKNDHFKSLLDRMSLFATEILDAKNIQFDFNSDPLLNTARISMKQRKSLYLFFKETINNSAKHSRANKIVVNIRKRDQCIEININDDGDGFDTTAIYHGNGMNSLKRRAEDLSATYSVESQANKGTSVQLKFKIA